MTNETTNQECQDILDSLIEGNNRYASGNPTLRDSKTELERSQSPQAPKAVVLSCLDSRVPVETLFDQGVGDLFVGRVAGNVCSDDIVGSFEFATVLSGVKVIIVMGHTKCGAIMGACNNAELGSLTQLLDKIQPAVKLAKQDPQAQSEELSETDFANLVAHHNVLNTAQSLLVQSPEISKLVKANQLLLVPAMYDLHTQKVSIIK